jgi:hypothetical protein
MKLKASGVARKQEKQLLLSISGNVFDNMQPMQ